jgi:hypothetical protein
MRTGLFPCSSVWVALLDNRRAWREFCSVGERNADVALRCAVSCQLRCACVDAGR